MGKKDKLSKPQPVPAQVAQLGLPVVSGYDENEREERERVPVPAPPFSSLPLLPKGVQPSERLEQSLFFMRTREARKPRFAINKGVAVCNRACWDKNWTVF